MGEGKLSLPSSGINSIPNLAYDHEGLSTRFGLPSEDSSVLQLFEEPSCWGIISHRYISGYSLENRKKKFKNFSHFIENSSIFPISGYQTGRNKATFGPIKSCRNQRRNSLKYLQLYKFVIRVGVDSGFLARYVF